MKQLYTLSIGLLCLSVLSAQKDLNGIINTYAAVQALDACNNNLTVDDASGFSEGQDVILYQAQGASIDLSNSSSFGNVSNLGQAGRYEKNQVLNINGNVVTLAFQLSQTYDPAGKVQLISFPQFDKVVVSDTLKGASWDGNKGGIIALQVTDTLELLAPISATGIGFRGGISDITVSNNCSFATNANNYAYASDNWRGAAKGEGLAIITPGSEGGRGPQANGGGGGNDHNAGGGGGSNLTKAGQGGTNEEPSFFGCDGNFPGFGGREISSDSTRLFFGGGGGAGHENNDVGTDGGNGGGIIILLVNHLLSNGFTIEANGESPELGGGDGAGGGGGGGSILLLYTTPGPVSAQALGGNGGSLDHRNADRCHGPGGGGSGGHILTNGLNPDLATQTAGGTAGLGFNSGACADGNNSSEPGSTGLITLIQSINTADQGFSEASIVAQAPNLSLCEGADGFFRVIAQGVDLTYRWQVDRGNGLEDLSNDADFQGVDADTLRLLTVTADQNNWRFRVLISNACGDNLTSQNADLTVSPSPIATFTPNQNGNDFTFTNTSQNASSYNWEFGDGAMSSEVSPTHTYPQAGEYTVVLTAFADCDTVQTSIQVSIAGAPTASFTSSPNEGCAPLTVNFTNTSAGDLSSISWSFPGGNPAFSTEENPVISYQNPGNYDVVLIVANAAGVDSVRLNNHVMITPNTVAAFTPNQNGSDFTFTNTSQNATSYSWDFGDGVVSSEASPMHSYNQPGDYTVTLTAFGICDTVQTSTVVSIT
ncbi:MAG: PKD domain-containing protein, partial [Saprospiraceae bacterium]|nr:PKD domain-containing protein [Saprospiraceae bacterium]